MSSELSISSSMGTIARSRLSNNAATLLPPNASFASDCMFRVMIARRFIPSSQVRASPISSTVPKEGSAEAGTTPGEVNVQSSRIGT
jgi:hypothetical protein